jgi:hypothetical protein
MKRIALLLFLVLTLQGQVQAGVNTQKSYSFTKQEGENLVNSLFKACNPDLPENTYMPTLLRQKLRWVYVEKLSHRLGTHVVFNDKGEFGSIAMFSGYEGGTPYIAIVVDDVVLAVRVDGGLQTGFSRVNKNSFCMMLAHEAVHLEKPKSFFTVGKRTREELLQEEFRTYKRLEPVVRGLLDKKEPLDNEHLEMYEVIAKCPSSVSCPVFTEYFSKRTKNIPNFPVK